jgi:hypothetical protein
MRQTQNLHVTEFAVGQAKEMRKGDERQDDHEEWPQARRQQRHQQTAENQNEAGGKLSDHNSPRDA